MEDLEKMYLGCQLFDFAFKASVIFIIGAVMGLNYMGNNLEEVKSRSEYATVFGVEPNHLSNTDVKKIMKRYHKIHDIGDAW